MNIGAILSPTNVLVDIRAADKSALLKDLARRSAAGLGLAPDIILNALLKREELGSTGLGDGIALPHTRLPEVTKPLGFLARLRHGIDFNAIDGRKVDLVFLLLLPVAGRGDDLNALASVARKLRDTDVRLRLRMAKDAPSLHQAIVEDCQPPRAA